MQTVPNGCESEIMISLITIFSKDELCGKSVLVKIVAASVGSFGRIIPNRPITTYSCFGKM
jgi:hypothetical protein